MRPCQIPHRLEQRFNLTLCFLPSSFSFELSLNNAVTVSHQSHRPCVRPCQIPHRLEQRFNLTLCFLPSSFSFELSLNNASFVLIPFRFPKFSSMKFSRHCSATVEPHVPSWPFKYVIMPSTPYWSHFPAFSSLGSSAAKLLLLYNTHLVHITYTVQASLADKPLCHLMGTYGLHMHETSN